jgi:RNA polymerase-binding transcription factor DksA
MARATDGTPKPGTDARPGTPARPRRYPKGGPTKADLKRHRQALEAARAEVLRKSGQLASEALKASGQDFSVDHMADHGTDNFEQDFTLALLEGESETVREIDAALAKIAGRGELPYGLCETCAESWAAAGFPPDAQPWIPRGRLDVVPQARLCVRHQEALEEGP